MVGARAICLPGQKHERRDEEGVSIDTIHTHNFSPSILTISTACSSLHSALRAVVLVVAHLQAPSPATPASPVRHATTGQSCIGRGARRSAVSLISGHAQKYVVSYALLAIAREPFELCPNFKSPPSIARRELSIDLRWPASKLETQNPPLRSDPRIGHILGEGGDKTNYFHGP